MGIIQDRDDRVRLMLDNGATEYVKERCETNKPETFLSQEMIPKGSKGASLPPDIIIPFRCNCRCSSLFL